MGFLDDVGSSTTGDVKRAAEKVIEQINSSTSSLK